MADDSTINAGTGGDRIAADELATLNGVATVADGSGKLPKAQRVKIGTGVDGTFTDVSTANPVPIVDPDATATGTISATDTVLGTYANDGALKTGTPTTNSYVALPLTGGRSAFTVLLTGTFGGGTVWQEVSPNSTNGVDGSWVTALGRQSGVNLTTLDESLTSPGIYRGNASGMTYARWRITGATTPSVAIVARSSAGTGAMFLNASIPAGSNVIGNVGTQSVLGTQIAGTLTTAAASATGTASTTATVVCPVSTAGNVTITVAGATTGTSIVVFEQSDDGAGLTWGPLQAVRSNDGNIVIGDSITAGLSARFYDCAVEGITHIRVRCSTAPATGGLAVRMTPGGFLAEPMVSAITQIPQNPQIDNAGTPRPILTAGFNVSTAQTGVSIVATPGTGLAIRVLSYMVIAGAAMNVSLIGPATTVLLPLVANTGVSFAGNLLGPAFQCAANTALTYTTSAAGQATGHFSYVIV